MTNFERFYGLFNVSFCGYSPLEGYERDEVFFGTYGFFQRRGRGGRREGRGNGNDFSIKGMEDGEIIMIDQMKRGFID
jgi:hypothetical protein